jgi:hypothetical protein
MIASCQDVIKWIKGLLVNAREQRLSESLIRVIVLQVLPIGVCYTGVRYDLGETSLFGMLKVSIRREPICFVGRGKAPPNKTMNTHPKFHYANINEPPFPDSI